MLLFHLVVHCFVKENAQVPEQSPLRYIVNGKLPVAEPRSGLVEMRSLYNSKSLPLLLVKSALAKLLPTLHTGTHWRQQTLQGLLGHFFLKTTQPCLPALPAHNSIDVQKWNVPIMYWLANTKSSLSHFHSIPRGDFHLVVNPRFLGRWVPW
jgi:hypothetical protein